MMNNSSCSTDFGGCRWIAFTTGIAYGAFHLNRLAKKETRRREMELAHLEELKKQKAIKKMKENRTEMLALAKVVGVPIPPDFEEQFKIPE